MKISAIVAIAKNNIMGKDNNIPWYLPADLKYFKKVTLGHPILMGRKTYLSIGRPLPKRTNIILTRNPFFIAANCLVVHSVQEGLEIAQEENANEVFIIGGSQIYESSMDYWDRLYLTTVDAEVEGDIIFPELDFSEWQLVSEVKHKADDKNEYDYTFKVFDRKSAIQEEE